MKTSRTVVGAAIGAVAAGIWTALGSEVFGWMLLFALIGGLIGRVLDDPSRLIEYLKRLER